MEREFDIYELMEPEHLPCSEPEDYEPDCECRFSGDMADASECELHGSARKPMGRADSIVWDIRVEAIPASPGYYAWVSEHEERFGVTHGETPEAAVANMREWIEFKTEVA